MIRIRSAQPGDADAVSTLIRQLLPGQAPAGQRLAAVFSAVLSSPGHCCVVALDGDRVIGLGSLSVRPCLWHGGWMGFVDELVVDRDHRGRGVGSRLLAHLERRAAELGCTRIELDTAPGREAAIAFYRGRGFDTRALLLSKPLQGTAGGGPGGGGPRAHHRTENRNGGDG